MSAGISLLRSIWSDTTPNAGSAFHRATATNCSEERSVRAQPHVRLIRYTRINRVVRPIGGQACLP